MTLPRSAFALSFDAVAEQYADARPGYPPVLLDVIEEIAGRTLAGADVLDVGAGTGIATRLLRDRGARVTAVEPGAGMAAQLRSAAPGAPLVRADGNALPFAAGIADFVTYAQSWHWTEPARSVPEAVRVLRPGGALALWWNVPDRDVPWVDEQEKRLAARLPGYHRHGVTGTAARLIDELAPVLGPAPHRGPGAAVCTGPAESVLPRIWRCSAAAPTSPPSARRPRGRSWTTSGASC